MALMNVPRSRYLAALLAGAVGCNSGDLLLPDPPGGGSVQLSKVDGDGQEGTVGEQLPKPLVVKVLNSREEPAMGRRVAFVITSPAETATPDTVVTNSEGVATGNVVLGTLPGDYVIAARLVVSEDSIQTQEFRVEAKPAPPDTLSPLTPQSQPGRRGRSAATPPSVRVVDRFGNPVPGVPVAWQVIAGEGETSESIGRTTVEGTATVEWKLGDRIGVHKLTATIEQATGSPVTFTVTVLF
jgi:hypothetical protein